MVVGDAKREAVLVPWQGVAVDEVEATEVSVQHSSTK